MDKVIVAPAGNGGKVYHTDVECPNVEQMEHALTRSLETLPDHMSKCEWCNGEWLDKVRSGCASDLATQLKDMDPSEL